MDDVVAFLQIEQTIDAETLWNGADTPPHGDLPEDFVMGDDDGIERAEDEALMDEAERFEILRDVRLGFGGFL